MKYMKMTVCLVMLCVLAQSAPGQTYKIQLKEFPDPGKKMEEKSSEKSKESVKVSVMGMVVKEESKEKTGEKVVTLTTLEKGEGTPKKYQKTFTKAVSIEDNKETALPYQGRTITYELKNGKYEVTADGAPLPEETLKKLRDSANKEIDNKMTKILLPAKEVKVGETWKIDVARLAKGLEENLPADPAKSSAEGKLVKVYQKDGHQFGVLEFDIKLSITSLGPLKLNNALPFNMHFTVDSAIDGSTTQGTMHMRGDLKGKTEVMQGGQTLSIEMDVQVSGRQEQSAEK